MLIVGATPLDFETMTKLYFGNYNEVADQILMLNFTR